MIAVGTNLLVYAHRQDSIFHDDAREVVRQLAEARTPWALPWPCVHEFLAIVTHRRIYSPPTPLAKAIDQVDAWLESPSIVLLAETNDYWQELKGTLVRSRVSGPQVHDARIAALCVQHGVRELLSADRDFSRFGGVPVRNPLTDQ